MLAGLCHDGLATGLPRNSAASTAAQHPANHDRHLLLRLTLAGVCHNGLAPGLLSLGRVTLSSLLAVVVEGARAVQHVLQITTSPVAVFEPCRRMP
jgi:hypothetical protein